MSPEVDCNTCLVKKHVSVPSTPCLKDHVCIGDHFVLPGRPFLHFRPNWLPDTFAWVSCQELKPRMSKVAFILSSRQIALFPIIPVSSTCRHLIPRTKYQGIILLFLLPSPPPSLASHLHLTLSTLYISPKFPTTFFQPCCHYQV